MFETKSDKKILFFGPKGSYTDIAKDKFIEKFGFENCEEISKYTIISLIKEIIEYLEISSIFAKPNFSINLSLAKSV